MAVTLSSLAGAGAQFFDDNGVLLAGGLIYTYAAGTTTPAVTYTSSTGLTAHANPIVLDAAGRIATGEIWLTTGVDYKFIIQTALFVQLGSYDNIPSINDFTTVNAAIALVYTNLANTSDIAKGDALVGFKQSNASVVLTNATSRTVHQKLQEFVSVKDFGAVGDGSTDDTTAISNAISAAIQYNVAIYIPSGTYKLTAKITKSSATKISIIGDGSQLSVLEWAAGATGGGGIDLTYTDVLFPCDVQSLSFVTNDDALGTGLKITGPEAASVTVLGPNVRDLRFTGKDVASNCWLDNLHFYTCWYITLGQISIKGKDGTTTFTSNSGIKLTSCQVIYASKFTIIHVDVGILEVATGVASHGEGFSFAEFEIVGCTKGISLFADGIAPGTNIGSGHINANAVGIEIANQYQTCIHDMLIYRTQFSVTPYTGIVLYNANSCIVHDNNIHGLLVGTGDMVGISMTGTTENQYLEVHDNIFRNFAGTSKVGIAISTGTGLSNIHDNLGDSSLTALFVIDAAADKTNRFHNNFPVEIQTLEVNSATPSVGNDINGQWNATNTSSTTITNFLNGYTSQIIYVYATNSNTTIQSNANIILSGTVNFAMGSGAVLMLRRDSTVWREISRNVP